MPTLKQVREITRTVTVPIAGDGEPLEIQYFPVRYNRKLQQDISQLLRVSKEKVEKGEEPTLEESETSARLLAAVLSGWNLTDDKGATCPISVQFLAEEAGHWIINAALDAIREDMNPGN